MKHNDKNRIYLSEQEKQFVVQCLDEGKPLPEEYRFLLFGDKKNIELVWPSKTSKATNIVLPFQTIEIVDEPRAEKPEDAKSEDTEKQICEIIKSQCSRAYIFSIDYKKNVMPNMRWTHDWTKKTESKNKEFLFLMER